MDFLFSPRNYLKVIYVVFAFCSVLLLGALKGLIVGPIAGLIIIAGNVGVILGLFPAHVGWTFYTLLKINRFDIPLKVAIILALPALFGLWLALSIACSVLVGIGYGFFTPWVSTFEAFRHGDETNKFLHSFLDGTWGTVKGSCTVVRDFADMCYHSYPLFLKELRESSFSDEIQTLRLIHVPACVMVVIMGLIVEIPSFAAIALVKSPYMLFKGWFRLTHDLVSREGPFLETACIPVAGLAILTWPIVVIGSVLIAIFSSIFVSLYAAVVVYQERSFRRGLAYVIAMVAEFDEYTNDWLYLREGTIFPKPRYRKKKLTQSSEISIGGNYKAGFKLSSVPMEAPAMLVPSLAHSRSVREAIQEVKLVQVWGNMMKSCELRGKELLDGGVIEVGDLHKWLKAKKINEEDSSIVSFGLPSYSFLHTLLNSIKANSDGLVLVDGVEINHLNRPKDRLLDWFFNPVLVLKEQIRVIKLSEPETRFLEKLVLFGGNTRRVEARDNPEDAVRTAQIHGISRRMIGMVRSVSKFPTYRRIFRQVVKNLIASMEEEVEEEDESSSVIVIEDV